MSHGAAVQPQFDADPWKYVKDFQKGISKEPKAFSKQAWFLYFWQEAVAAAGHEGMLADSARHAAEALAKFDRDARAAEMDRNLNARMAAQAKNPEAKARYEHARDLQEQNRLKAVSDKAAFQREDFRPDQREIEQFSKNVERGHRALIAICRDLPGKTPMEKLNSIDHLSDDELLLDLTALLRVGFRGVAITPAMGTDTWADNIISCQRKLDGVTDVEVGWRCETRSWSLIKAHGGVKRQVDVQQRAKELNMDKPWHPFSTPFYKQRLWFRLGVNKDNCFYSVISVGKSIRVVSSFPLLSAAYYPDLPTTSKGNIKAPRSWNFFQKKLHSKNIATVTVSGQSRIFLATPVHAYMFLMKGLVLDDSKANRYYGSEGFPENGMEHIGLDDIYACWPLLRVHHEKLEDDSNPNGDWMCNKETGHTVFIGPPEYAFTRPQRDCRYGEAALQKLEAEFNTVTTLAPNPAFTVKWHGTQGSTGVEDGQNIERLVAPMPPWG